MNIELWLKTAGFVKLGQTNAMNFVITNWAHKPFTAFAPFDIISCITGITRLQLIALLLGRVLQSHYT
jgi:hypothetical protein